MYHRNNTHLGSLVSNTFIKDLPMKLQKAFSGWGLSLEGLRSNRKGEWWLIIQLIVISSHLLSPWPYLNNTDSYILVTLKYVGLISIVVGVIRADL